MDVGSALGIASLGIQVCQGLLSYYDGWKGYETDITNAYDCVADLAKTLTLLKDSLKDEEVSAERRERVKSCLQSCEGVLQKLSKKLQKLRTYSEPEGMRQKAWAEVQKAWYPCRASTLQKLREIVDDVQDRVGFALQVLQLDISTKCLKAVAQVATDTTRILAAQQVNTDRKFIKWLSPLDPSTTHASARHWYEPQTGVWLLQSRQYQKWKTGDIRHLWLHGKSGCGKTILCSTAIEDVEAHCKRATNSGHAMFYFSFSDNQTQSVENLLRSLISQLCCTEPDLAMLRQAYENHNRSLLGVDDLENILTHSIQSYDEVFLLLDALDETLEGGGARQNVLEQVERLSQRASNLRILVTSRELRDIRESMEILRAFSMSITAQCVDPDILRYVAMEMSRHRRLVRLDPPTQALIRETLAMKADGSFRWAYCQLQELKELTSTKPKYVKEILRTLPPTLDATYERMLNGIKEIYFEEAFTLLRWLAFAERPLSVAELAEASIISASEYTNVDTANRGSAEDIIAILPGLVMIEKGSKADCVGTSTQNFSVQAAENVGSASLQHISKTTKVKLEHFSVKEYLVSERIARGKAKRYALNEGRTQAFLAQSCFGYILYCFDNSKLLHSFHDANYPLCAYAMRYGMHHQRSAENQLGNKDDVGRHQIQIMDQNRVIAKQLSHFAALRKGAHSPDGYYHSILWKQDIPALHLACLLGLHQSVSILLVRSSEADINETAPFKLFPMPGYLHTALHCAVYSDSLETVDLLLSRGANIEAGADSGECTPLYLASWLGKLHIVKCLIDHGANVNIGGGPTGTPLQAACSRGSVDVAHMLLDFGAEIDASGGYDGSALCAAARGGNEDLVNLLLDHGANINFGGKYAWTALHIASDSGHENVARLLLHRKAEAIVNSEDGLTALHLAAARRRESIVRLLLQHESSARLHLVDFLSIAEALDRSWNDFCETAEFTDEDDVDWFELERGRMENITQLLLQAAASLPSP